MKNDPSGPLTISRKMPLASLRATTETPGSTAFCASTTRPRSSPVPCCAETGRAGRSATTTMATIDPRRCIDLLRCEAPNGGDLTDRQQDYNERLMDQVAARRAYQF